MIIDQFFSELVFTLERNGSKMNKKILTISIISVVVAVMLISGIIWYISGTKPVNKQNEQDTFIEIEQGARTEEILNLLQESKIIKNKLVAAIYMKLHNVSGLQAGKYELKQNMSLKEVLEKIAAGEVYDERVKITFLEGKNMKWIAKTIAEKTINTEEDVFNLLKDKEYIEEQIDKYWFLTNEITDSSIYYPLEGYLYPDTYVFENAEVSVKTIFNIILNQTDKILEKHRTQFKKSEKSIHEILTIASIVELEGNNKESREGIASVIYNRLKSNMSIGSDVTTYYAMQIDMGERNLYKSEINTENPYNTRGPKMNGKLPIGPIASPSEESINAALNPSNTKYLYFVADINGKIYFTSTYEEHQNKIKDLQKQGLWYEYKK